MAGLVLASASTAAAAKNYAGTTFEIEMIVFSRDSGMAQSAEDWPASPRLKYPRQWVDFDTMEPMEKQEDESGPRPFLQPAPTQLDAKAAAIGDARGQQVLFHKAWRQVLQNKRNAPAILLTGGNRLGEHYELEGSVTLSVARYLHLSTNLWLSELDPAAPTTVATDNAVRGITLPRRPVKETGPSSAPSSEPVDLMVQAAEAPSVSTQAINTGSDASFTGTVFTDIATADSEFSDAAITAPALTEFDEPQPPLTVQNVALLQQERRMKSGELHYLDHPRFGVLIEIRTVQPAEEEVDQSPP
ncbi:hypothetical protein Maes01_00035 [Microbulbifer aestuariivivens]|uniref:Peptidoglycan-binding protein CsiV n=2 Tax=Microbulbifer aestuariivivens TaxID=1908308 RepID=A0ABP9WJV7_9GAMM